jgi:hypothetical protein
VSTWHKSCEIIISRTEIWLCIFTKLVGIQSSIACHLSVMLQMPLMACFTVMTCIECQETLSFICFSWDLSTAEPVSSTVHHDHWKDSANVSDGE